jgi:hypothetical protein
MITPPGLFPASSSDVCIQKIVIVEKNYLIRRRTLIWFLLIVDILGVDLTTRDVVMLFFVTLVGFQQPPPEQHLTM